MVSLRVLPTRRHPLSYIPLIILLLTLESISHFILWRVPVPAQELDAPFHTTCQTPPSDPRNYNRQDAAIVMLARNEEVEEAAHSITQVEARFNRWFQYPVLFLNDKPWDETFMTRMRSIVSGEVLFEVLPNNTWGYPEGQDVEDAEAHMADQGRREVPYGNNAAYHHMCRFFSGDFFLLDALKPFRYYWRVEPSVKFFCDLTYDPFLEMARNNKAYGWTMALWEVLETAPSLFAHTAEYKATERIPDTGLWRSMVTPEWMPWPFRRWHSGGAGRDRNGDKWTKCHFWSNFEIADLEFFRGPAYQKYYQYLLSKGGFYNERWGDAAIHSLAVSMLLPSYQIHYFADIGYQHDNLWVCPANAPGGLQAQSGEPWDQQQEDGIGCRCNCPGGGKRRRNTQDYCTVKMTKPNVRQGRTWL